MSINHNWSALPVATVTRATQDPRGLLLEGEFHGTADAQACRRVIMERLQRGKSVKASIGYKMLDDATMTENGKSFRLLKSIELYEFILVSVPANPNADFLAAKASRRGDPLRRRRALFRVEATLVLSGTDIGTKSGRTLSAATRRRLESVARCLRGHVGDLEALLTEADSAVDAAEEEQALDLRRRRTQLKARLVLMGIGS